MVNHADIYYTGVTLSGNLELELDPSAVLTMHPNDKWDYCLFRLNKESNLTIRGGTLVGDRYGHTYTPNIIDGALLTAHDEGHGICIEGSSKVLIDNIVAKEFTADGVLVGFGAGMDATQD